MGDLEITVRRAEHRDERLEELSVDDDLRRNGLGTLLVREFERRCGAGVVALATRRAPDFYASLGYEASATYFRRIL